MRMRSNIKTCMLQYPYRMDTPALDLSHARIALIALLILSAFFMLFRLGAYPLRDYDEATYASIAREGLERSDITLLTLHGEPNFTKPPLYFALAHASAKLFGTNEFAFRLPSAIFGLLTVLLTYFVALHVGKHRVTALLSALALVANGAFVEAARQVRLDTGVAFFAIAAFWCFVLGVRRPVFLTGIGIAGALFFLTKSLAILVIPPALLLGSIYYRDFRWLRSIHLWTGMILGCAILVPWLFVMHKEYGAAFWDTFLLAQGFSRIATPIIGQGVTTLTYLFHLFRFTEPWFLLFLGVLIYNARSLFLSPRVLWAEHKEAVLFGGISLFIFILFSLSKTKLFYYLLPMYPFLAIFCGFVLAEILLTAERGLPRQAAGFFIALLFSIGLISGVYFGFHIDDSIGVNLLAREEKAIGEALLPYPEKSALYAKDHLFWETIEYYSHGKKVDVLPEPSLRPSDYFLIIPSVLERDVPSITNAPSQNLYQGPYLSLFKVSR